MLYQCGDGGVSQIIPMEGGPNARPPPPVRGTQMEALEACKNPNFQPEQEEQDMKKRLLSAALALAMVLTMLPLTAFAATTATTKTAYYHVKDMAFSNPDKTNTVVASAESGWYERTEVKDSNNKLTGYTYTKISDAGWVNSVSSTNGATATWYSAMGEVTIDGKAQNLKPSSFTLTGALAIDSLDWTISNGRLNGNTLTISALAETTGTNSRVSSYSITVYGTGEKNDASKLALPSGAISGRTLTLNVTDAEVNGFTMKNEMDTTDATKVKYYAGGTVKITNGKLTGDITMPKGTITLSGVVAGSSAITMGTSASGQGGTVTLDKGTTTTGGIALYGPSTLNVYDTSSAGAVTVFGGGKDDVPTNAGKTDDKKVNPNWSGARINLATSGKVTSIGHASASMGLNGTSTNETTDLTTHTVDGKTNSGAGGVTLNYADVTLNGAGANDVAVKVGSVKLSDNATAGAITLGDNASSNPLKGKCTLDVSGAGTTVTGAVKTSDVAATDLTVKISNGKFTNSSSGIALGDDYKGGGITGGTFSAKITNTAWMSNVAYEIARGTSGTTYTYTNSLAEAVSAYTDAPSSNTVSIAGTTNGIVVNFELDNSGDVVFSLRADANTRILLPSTLGNRSVTTWYNGSVPYPANDYFQVQGTSPITLKAISTDADLGTINGVTAEVVGGSVTKNLTAELVGNTIKLSGAVELGSNNYANLKLTFTTTTNKTGLAYGATYYDSNPKQVLFGAVTGVTNSADLVVSTGDKEIALKGSTIRYTVDCSGLRKLEAVGVASAATEQVVTISGTNLGATEKTNLIEALKKTTFVYDGTGSGSNSNALLQAVNKALASYTASSIDSAVKAGQREAAKKIFNTTSPTSDQLKDTRVLAYTQLNLQVYLDIRVTGITRSGAATSGSITLDITPKYHEVVSNGTADQDVVNPAARNLDANLLKSTDGAVDITLSFPAANTGPTIFKAGDTLWAHHGDYVYEVKTTNKFTNLHGFSSFTINTVGPVAGVDTIVRNGEVVGTAGTVAYHYDSLAQAVADVADGGTVTVNSGYEGTTAIPVSGGARQFTVNNKANAGTALTFTGANVTSNGKNDQYTVELTQDNFTNAVISVGSAGNGTASVNTTVTKPGSTVSGTYKANSGYKAGSFTATAQPGNKSVSVSVSANGTFSFTVPSDATSVTVTPSFVLDNGLPFTDVANNAWYFTAVKYCYDTTNNGYRLMEGDSAATFAPNGSFTRAHMVQILWNMKGRPTPRTTANPFRDMSSSNWYYSAVLWAYENGYAKGYPDGTFKPGQAVTRQEMVQFLYQASGSPSGSGNLSYYSDGYTANNWAQPALRWATGLGILSGQNSASLGNTLAPRAVAKRCEVAVTVMNFDKLNLF